MFGSSSKAKTKRSKRERGIAVMVTALILMVAVPTMGLMFDGTLMFVVKARLQGALDGAVLAGARALARGNDNGAQKNAAKAVARNYIQLNYPNNFMFGGTISVDSGNGVQVDESVANQRTVTATASVPYPGLFMRTFLGATAIVGSASAIRRDVNVMIVMDRSGSLYGSNSCEPLKAAAANFVGQFAPKRDNVGLVTFASSTYVNFPIGNTFATASPNIVTMIASISCAGSTSSAMGLWTGYQQLIALNQPGAFNAILFFTDGQPTGIAYDMPVSTSSPCSGYTAGSTSGGNMTIPSTGAIDAYTLPTSVTKGYIRGVYNTFINVSEFFGPLARLGYTGLTGQQQLINYDFIPPDATSFAPSANCTYFSGWANDNASPTAPNVHNLTNTSDFVGVPIRDIFGNSTNTGYQSITLDSHGLIDISNGTNAQNMALNGADSAATNIRNGVTDPVSGGSLSGITIFSIGLGNAAIPASPDFLERVSNDPRSPIYDASKPAGAYIYAASAADLQTAFSEVASEILRLAR